jgi:hypothetical protein
VTRQLGLQGPSVASGARGTVILGFDGIKVYGMIDEFVYSARDRDPILPGYREYKPQSTHETTLYKSTNQIFVFAA